METVISEIASCSDSLEGKHLLLPNYSAYIANREEPPYLALPYHRPLYFRPTRALQTQEAEKMIEKMEQDEDALIERLKKIQEKQRKAYDLLQESLEK